MLTPFDRVLATILHVNIEGTDGVSNFLEHAGRECEWFRGRTIESDSRHFVAAFDGPARAIRCATALAGAAGRFRVVIRAGLHTGECAVDRGVPTGTPVRFASRIADCTPPGEVFVSRTVRDIVGDAGLPFEDRGVHRIADMGEWKLFSV